MNDRRVRSLLYWANAAVLVMVVLWMGWITARTIEADVRSKEFARIQLEFVTEQNEDQLCGLRTTLIAVRKIGLRLGLPVQDIELPNVEGFACGA